MFSVTIQCLDINYITKAMHFLAHYRSKEFKCILENQLRSKPPNLDHIYLDDRNGENRYEIPNYLHAKYYKRYHYRLSHIKSRQRIRCQTDKIIFHQATIHVLTK